MRTNTHHTLRVPRRCNMNLAAERKPAMNFVAAGSLLAVTGEVIANS